MKPFVNLIVLVAVAFIVWTFKNTPWASTTFLGYLILLVVEGSLTRRLEKAGSEMRSTSTKEAATRAIEPSGSTGRATATMASAVATRKAPRLTFTRGFGVILFAVGFMLLADNAVGLKWFDFDTAGQPGWLGAVKWIAEGICFLATFVTPILVGLYFALHFSEEWSSRHLRRSGQPRDSLEFLGYVAGALLGAVTYVHLALAPLFHDWLVRLM